MFSESFLANLSERVDIVDIISRYVPLTKRTGSNLVGLCPFHNEKTPSFSVSPSKQFYHCFGCGAGGDVITFMMKVEGLDFLSAVERLCQIANIPLPEDMEGDSDYKKRRERATLCSTEAAKFYYACLNSDKGKAAKNYLLSRGLSEGIITKFGLGFSPNEWDSVLKHLLTKGFSKSEILDAGLTVANKSGGFYDRFRNRIMFPIFDKRGSVIGFGGRVMDDSMPKYLNSPETSIFNKSRNLFALNFYKKNEKERIILCEGYMDVIALFGAGIPYAVASLGTSLTEQQVKLISQKANEVIVAYDSDEAGVKAANRVIEMIRPSGLSVKVLRISGAKDPDEFIKKFGKERFLSLLDKSESDVEYKLMSERLKYDISFDEGKIKYLISCAEILAAVRSPVEQEIYATNVANELKISKDSLLNEIKNARNRYIKQQKKKETQTALMPRKTMGSKVGSIKYKNPRSEKAEQELISSILSSGNALRIAAEKIAPEEFSSEILKKVYGEILRMDAENLPISSANIMSGLTDTEKSYLTEVLLTAKTEDAEAVTQLIDIIKLEHLKKHDDGSDESFIKSLEYIKNRGRIEKDE